MEKTYFLKFEQEFCLNIYSKNHQEIHLDRLLNFSLFQRQVNSIKGFNQSSLYTSLRLLSRHFDRISLRIPVRLIPGFIPY